RRESVFRADDGTYGFELWDPPVGATAPAGGHPGTVPTSPAPAPPAGAASVGSGTSVPASPPGGPWWRPAFWLGALLALSDPGAAAAGQEWAWLALLGALPPGQSAPALDLLLAGLASGDPG